MSFAGAYEMKLNEIRFRQGSHSAGFKLQEEVQFFAPNELFSL